MRCAYDNDDNVQDQVADYHGRLGRDGEEGEHLLDDNDNDDNVQNQVADYQASWGGMERKGSTL